MVSVDTNALIDKIVTLNPEVKKEDLQQLSETELQTKLAQSLSGDKVDANVDTVTVTPPPYENTGVEPNLAILAKEEAEDSAIQTINDNAEQAQKMIDNQDDGVISKVYDKYKEATNSELAKSNVQDVVDKQSQTAEFLQEAKDGKLTYKDYLERKRNTLLNLFPNIDKYNDEQKQKIKQGIDTLDVDTTNRLQQQILALPNKDDAEYKTKAKEFFTEFLNVSTIKTEQKTINDEISTSSTTTRLKKAYNPSDGDRLMTFEEVFKAEQGVEFNKDNIQKYNESTQQFAYANYLINKKQEIHNLLDNILDLANGNNANGVNSSTIANSNNQLKTSIYLALSKLYGNDIEKINKGLQELTGENYSFKIKNPNDKLSLDDFELENQSISENSQFKFSTDSQLPTIAKLILDKIDKNTNNAMGGKSLDDYAKTMAEDYKNAYGFRDANALANAFAQDQEGIVQTARNGVQIVGTVVMVGGMAFCPPAALGGGLIASFGGIGVEALNESTKQNASPEKMNELKKEFAQNVELFAVGAGAGKLGSSAKTMLTAKNAPKFVAMIGDIGVDSTVSLIGDLVLTGQLDITGEGFSQVMSLIAGHKGKIVKGVQHLKEKVNDKFRLQSENPNRNIIQMPNGTLVEVKPDGSTVEVKADEVSQNNHSTEQPIELKKVDIGGEDVEVATQKPLLADKTSTDNQIFKSEEEFKEFLDNEKTSVDHKDKFSADTKKVLIDEFRKNPDLVTTLVTENVVVNLKGKTSRRFNSREIRILLPLLKENPELVNNLIKERTYNSIIGSNVPRFKVFQIEDLVSLSKENPELVNNLVKERYSENELRFDSNEIDWLLPLSKENPELVNNLIKERTYDSKGNNIPRFNVSQISYFVHIKNKDILNTLLNTKTLDMNGNQIPAYSNEIIELVSSTNDSNMINAIIKYCKTEDLKKYNLSFIKDIISKNETNIIPIADNIAKNNNIVNYHINYGKGTKFKDSFCITSEENNTIKTIIFDKNGNILKSNSLKLVENNTGGKQRSTVFENYNDDSGNNVSFISRHSNEVNSDALPTNIKNQYVKEVKSPDGKVLYKEYHVPSKDYPNKFDIYREENGRRYKIGSTETTNNGQYQNIERTIHSSDGTQTQYFYAENANGRMTNTIIKDKNGNILLNNKQQFNKVDDNHYVSKENGKTYDIQYFDDKVVVKNDNGETIEIPIVENGNDGLSKDLLPLLKQLPGSILFDIKKYNLSSAYITKDPELKNNAAYSPLYKAVAMSPELFDKKDLFGLIHELGHFKDDSINVYSNKELLKIYNSERDELLKNSSETEFNEMDYFLVLEHPNKGGAITEMIAETNALRFSSNKYENLETRSMFMQEHFPKTFAKIVELLQQ